MSLESHDTSGKVVGIAGGVASGKSAVTQFLAELGGLVLNADEMAHEVLRQPEVVDLLVDHFGSQILLKIPDQDLGQNTEKDDRMPARVLDRSGIAKQVFGETVQHKSNRQFLESVVQSRVRDRLLREIEIWKNQSGAKTFLVLDVPLLFERDWNRFCDYVLMVDTPEAKRKENAVRRGWSEQDWRAREQSQMSIAEKRDRATHLISNDSSLDDLRTQVQAWYATHLDSHK
ncbi:MAG: dephospho-CoA kinase [Pirellula sp.]